MRELFLAGAAAAPWIIGGVIVFSMLAGIVGIAGEWFRLRRQGLSGQQIAALWAAESLARQKAAADDENDSPALGTRSTWDDDWHHDDDDPARGLWDPTSIYYDHSSSWRDDD